MSWKRPGRKRCLRGRLLAAVAGLWTVFSAHQALAAASYFDLTPEQLLNAEVISATKTPETVEQTPAAVYVITSEDIARTGVTSIADALRMAPGVDVAQGATGAWSINIRGFNKGLANQMLVMIDGRTVYNPLFAGTYWELQNLPVEDIARIEVIRGPGGTLWGANAVNGVINIITKKAQDTQGTLVRGLAGTLHTDSELAQRGGKAGNGYYRVYAQHMDDAPLPSVNGGETTETLQDNRTGFRYDSDDNLTVSGDAYTNRSDQLVSVPQFTSPYSTTVEDNRQSQGADILAHWRKHYADGSRLSLQSFVDYTSRDQTVLKDQEDIIDFDGQYDLPRKGRHQIIAGGGYRLTHENIGSTPTLSITPGDNTLNVFNIFVQDKIALVPKKWFLTLGSKAEHNDFTGLEFEPNARLQWFPDDRHTVWLSASRAVRTPSPLENELNLNAAVFKPGATGLNPTDPLEYNLVANRDFHSEQLIAYEAGYRDKITPDVSTDIAVFANNYKGLAAQQLVAVSSVTGPPAYELLQTDQANLMSAETYGGEAAAEWSVTPDWRLSGSVSALEMFLHLNNDFTGLQAEESQSSNYQASLRSYWNISKNLTFDTAAYYVDGLKAFGIPAYTRLDANLGWKISPGVQLNFVGQNLLQARHMEYGNATDLNAGEIPRSFYAKVTCRF